MMYRLANSNRSLAFASILMVLSTPAINGLTCRLAATPAMLDVRIGYHLAAGNADAAAVLIEQKKLYESRQRS